MNLFRRLFERLAAALIARASRREPDFIVGGHDNPYLERWWLIPRNPLFNMYLHRFLRDDDDRALHDHPWPWCSILLRGEYIEVTAPRFEFEGDREAGFLKILSEIPKDADVTASYEIGGGNLQVLMRQSFRPGQVRFRMPKFAHRIELLPMWTADELDDAFDVWLDRAAVRKPCWTLFVTGPRVRAWGFRCPNRGWVHWKRFTAPDDPGAIGPGCGE